MYGIVVETSRYLILRCPIDAYVTAVELYTKRLIEKWA